LPTPSEPLVVSIQKQKPIKSENPESVAQTEPQISTIQSVPTVEQFEIFEDPSQTNIQYSPDNENFVDSSPAFSAIPEQSPSNYPNIDTNTQRIVFPDDEEERYFSSYPQTDVSSSTAQVVSTTSNSLSLKIPTRHPTTGQPIQPISSSAPIKNAASQPFITCPSAMKCVEKINCNFNGVMVEEPVFLSPEQETQRVPLIPCFNTARRNAVDVCCRDPNYKDPWPNSGDAKNQQQQIHSQQQKQQQQQQQSQQQISDNIRQGEESINAPAQTAFPKKRRTNAYGK